MEGQILTVLIKAFRNSLAKAPINSAFSRYKYLYFPYDSSRENSAVFIYNIQRLLFRKKKAKSLLGDTRNESYVIFE